MKLGVHESFVDGVEIAELLKGNSSKSGDELISMKEYIDCTKEGQNETDYITDESLIPECLNFIKVIVNSKDSCEYFLGDSTAEQNKARDQENIVKNCLDALPEIAKKSHVLYILFKKSTEENCTTVIGDDKLHQPKDTMTSEGLNGWDVHYATDTKRRSQVAPAQRYDDVRGSQEGAGDLKSMSGMVHREFKNSKRSIFKCECE